MLRCCALILTLIISWTVLAAPICNTHPNGLIECTIYKLSPNGAALEYRIPYADLVPSGETRPIRITHALVHSFNITPTWTGQHVLLIEAPSGSNWWKMAIAWGQEGRGVERGNFSPGISLLPGEGLCFLQYSVYGASYAVHYFIDP